MSLMHSVHAPAVQRLAAIGVIPVVEITDADTVEPLAEALLEAGLPCVEVTFRTPAAETALERFAAYGSELLVGAGTVLTVEQADHAIAAGAAFLVAPGTNGALLDHARARSIPIVPGVCTPTDVTTALAHRSRVVKFFPAEACGGLPYLRALAAPFGDVEFIPTGGIKPENAGDYLAHPQVLACGGTWIAKKELLVAGDFGRVRDLAAEAVSCVERVRNRA